MSTLVRDIYARRELLLILISRNLKIRYKNSTLGFFWSLLSPLFLILIYAVFLRVMRFNIDLPVLVTGIIVWQFHAMCLGDALHAVLGNANLVTKTAFPRVILPLSMVGANLVNFLLSFCVLCIYLLAVGADCGPLLLLPVAVVTQFALCLGVGLIISAANVFFRDTEHVLSVIMLAWFFLTPIIYPSSLVMGHDAGLPAWTRYAFFANPMTGLVTTYRIALLSVDVPPLTYLCLSFGVAWLICILGLVVFQRAQPRFGDEL